MISSRIARKAIKIPKNVTVKLLNDSLEVAGPKGKLNYELNKFIGVEISADALSFKNSFNEKTSFTNASEKKTRKSILGTARANIANMIEGVTHGFEKKLTLIGVGYRAQSKGKVLVLSLGHSHADDFEIPHGITIDTPSQTEIIIKGIDKEQVGQVASNIRKIRPPEPYKGKGVRYANEAVERKEAKK